MKSREYIFHLIFGALMAIFSLAMAVSTMTGTLRPNARIVPYIAFSLIGVGGLMIALESVKNLVMQRRDDSRSTKRPSSPEDPEMHDQSGIAVVPILLILAFYSVLMPYVGILTTTFVFLTAWWTFCGMLRMKHPAYTSETILRVILHSALHAAPISIILYILFVVLLRVYFPNVLLI